MIDFSQLFFIYIQSLMIRLLLFSLLLFPLVGWGQDTVNYENLNVTEMWTVSYNDKPFTGIAIGYYKNGGKKFQHTYKGGRRDNPTITWYENSQKKSETNCLGKRKKGHSITWHQNGQKKSYANCRSGLMIGKCHYWDERGKLVKEELYEYGELMKVKNLMEEKGLYVIKSSFRSGGGGAKKTNGNSGIWWSIELQLLLQSGVQFDSMKYERIVFSVDSTPFDSTYNFTENDTLNYFLSSDGNVNNPITGVEIIRYVPYLYGTDPVITIYYRFKGNIFDYRVQRFDSYIEEVQY